MEAASPAATLIGTLIEALIALPFILAIKLISVVGRMAFNRFARGA